jgi:hypothetical protein
MAADPPETARDEGVTRTREEKSGATSPQAAVAADDPAASAMVPSGAQTLTCVALPC